MKKYLSLTLALLMVLSATSVFAAPGDQTVPVDLTVEEPIFNVTVPLSLPITIDTDGSILTADNVNIINNSAGPVSITGVQITGANGWKTAEFGTVDMTTSKVGSKDVSLKLGLGAATVETTGENTNDFTGTVRIAKGASLPIIYDAEVPAQKTANVGTQVASVIFTLGWDE